MTDWTMPTAMRAWFVALFIGETVFYAATAPPLLVVLPASFVAFFASSLPEAIQRRLDRSSSKATG